MRLGIVGSRNGAEQEWFDKQLADWVDKFGRPELIVSGGARGIDSMAERWANEHGIPVEVFIADWSKHGLAAGPIRNRKIVDACTHLLAFPSKSGRGTQNTIQLAQKAVDIDNHTMISVIVNYIPEN